MKFLIGNLIFLLTLPICSHANTFNAGFVEGLWYSEPQSFHGDSVRVYVALRNDTKHDLTGTVRFYANDARIGSMQVSALKGRLVEAWTDWSPTYGDHIVKAELANVRLHTIGDTPEHITLEHAVAHDTITIDYDTDGDDIGDNEDTDDDNDGVSDNDEKAVGTDPKVYDAPETNDEDTGFGKNEKEEDDNTNTKTVDETTHQSTGRSGLEVLTEDSVAGTMLSTLTDRINTTKQQLDTYRATLAPEETAQSVSGVEDSSDHTPTKTASTTAVEKDADNTPKTETETTASSTSMTTQTVAFLGSILSALYVGTLATISIFLGYPALVELVLLLLILYSIYRFARRFGRRPID